MRGKRVKRLRREQLPPAIAARVRARTVELAVARQAREREAQVRYKQVEAQGRQQRNRAVAQAFADFQKARSALIEEAYAEAAARPEGVREAA